ncbi:TPA: hypothetical protein ACH3X1_010304 [Trebouxia sp. C0004]
MPVLPVRLLEARVKPNMIKRIEAWLCPGHARTAEQTGPAGSEAQARAEQEVSKLQNHAKSSQQGVKRLEQQLAGSQAAAAEKEQELATQDELSKSLADRSSLQSKLQQALAGCKSLRGELSDAELEHNCTKCQLEAAVVDRNSSQGQLDIFKSKYDRLKGQHSKARAGHSNQERQCHDALLGAQQHSTQLADFQVARSMSASSAQAGKTRSNQPLGAACTAAAAPKQPKP